MVGGFSVCALPCSAVVYLEIFCQMCNNFSVHNFFFSGIIACTIVFHPPITFLIVCPLPKEAFNPFTPRSDQHTNSPYNSNTPSSRQVMRINKIIN